MIKYKSFLALGFALALGTLSSCRSKDDPTPTPTPQPQSGIKITNGVLTAYPEKEIKDGTVKLTDVTEVSDKVFENYKTLKAVEAPKLTKIGAAAFKGSALVSLTLGSTLPTVADDAFVDTPDAKDLVVPADKADAYRDFAIKHHFKTINGKAVPTILIEEGILKEYPEALLPADGKLTLAENVKGIAASVFEGKTQLKELHATHVTNIEAKAFKGCTSLAKVELGATVPTVADDAFVDTPNTKDLIVPADKVGDYQVFAKKHGFKTINGEELATLPDGVVVEGNTLVKWPASVPRQEHVTLPSYITKIRFNAFGRGAQVINLVGPNVEEIGEKAFADNSKLKTAFFPKLKKIGIRGVFNCAGLKTFDAPLLEEIGVGAFYKSSALTTINFPLLKVIPQDAFRAGYNGQLETIVLPKAESFGASAFNAQVSIKTIELGATPPSGALPSTFEDAVLKGKNPAPKVIVPASAVSTYLGTGTKWLGIFEVQGK